jgi:hypothetical protein
MPTRAIQLSRQSACDETWFWRMGGPRPPAMRDLLLLEHGHQARRLVLVVGADVTNVTMASVGLRLLRGGKCCWGWG